MYTIIVTRISTSVFRNHKNIEKLIKCGREKFEFQKIPINKFCH